MKLETPFDSDIYRKQNSLNFDLTWKKNFTIHRYRVFLGLFFILVGFFMLRREDYFGYALMGFGIHYITNFIDNFLNYRKAKKKHSAIIESEVVLQTKSNENFIWEFNEEDFYYKDYKLENRIKWFAFTGFRIIDSNLFLDINMGPTLTYIISEDEIGKEKFENITQIVKEKIG